MIQKSSTRGVICPHCRHLHDLKPKLYFEFHNPVTIQCNGCDRDFMAWMETTVDYISETIEAEE